LSPPGQNSTSIYLIYVMPLGGRRAATATAVGGTGSGAPANAIGASVAESPPIGPGVGYRLSATSAGDYDADWRQQFAGADVEVEAARNQGIEGRNAYLTGAMTLLDGQLNETRQVNGSFAMVDVAGLANVPVYVENQLTAYTDSTGRALLYNLRPYEANHISISPTELPLDTEIASSSEIVAPPYRSGVVARFPVERIRGGTFRLVTDDGKPVPVGAQVKLKGKLFPVVLDGMVYVTGYDHGMAAEACGAADVVLPSGAAAERRSLARYGHGPMPPCAAAARCGREVAMKLPPAAMFLAARIAIGAGLRSGS
jgi:outer membrane usher protein